MSDTTQALARQHSLQGKQLCHLYQVDRSIILQSKVESAIRLQLRGFTEDTIARAHLRNQVG